MTGPVPAFDDLPLIDKLGLRHAWGVFGADDQRGTINFITPEARAAAAATVTEGRSIRLDLPLTEPDPPLYGRKPLQHEVYASDRNNWDDRLDDFYPQASTQWDSLRHVRCREFGFWGGETGDPDSHDRLGIDNWATGVVGRGVLLDVDAHNHEATADAVRDGWYHSGDLGWVDDSGYVYLVDRRSDLIVSGGANKSIVDGSVVTPVWALGDRAFTGTSLGVTVRLGRHRTCGWTRGRWLGGSSARERPEESGR